MTLYAWKEIVKNAREHSPYYRWLYRDLPNDAARGWNDLRLDHLPIVQQIDFWEANSLVNNRLLTGLLDDGIVFKSGGTTGSPKFSVYTREEWETFTRIFGGGLGHAALRPGERVANLFYAGGLYASFIFIMKSIEAAPFAVSQFPIGGATAPEGILKMIEEFDIQVLAGVPTTLLGLAEYFHNNRRSYPGVRPKRAIFGGESMYPDQRERLLRVFPGIEIRSIGYASVDAGPLGYADGSCGPDEHRSFAEATVLEIVDEETGEVIRAENQPGRILVTNLTRLRMPIIRYPVGDRGQWLEPPSGGGDRKFRILGRAEEAARVGPVSVYFEDIRAFIHEAAPELVGADIQLLIRHRDRKDELTLKLVGKDSPEKSAAFVRRFGEQRPMFAESVAKDIIHPLRVEWITPTDLVINHRTGKLKRVLDER